MPIAGGSPWSAPFEERPISKPELTRISPELTQKVNHRVDPLIQTGSTHPILYSVPTAVSVFVSPQNSRLHISPNPSILLHRPSAPHSILSLPSCVPSFPLVLVLVLVLTLLLSTLSLLLYSCLCSLSSLSSLPSSPPPSLPPS